MKAIIAQKIGMTQVADLQGRVIPATLLTSTGCVVTQIKNIEQDGYAALQLGMGDRKSISKPLAGHFKASGKQPAVVREFRIQEDLSAKVGESYGLEQFSVGDRVDITAISKGKGFAGTVKRHHFHRGPVTHGSQNVRKPGSIGSMYPQRVIKGKRMAGRMGHRQVHLKKREIIYLDTKNMVIGIRGAIPGPRRGVVSVQGN